MRSVFIAACIIGWGLSLGAQDPLMHNIDFSVTLGTANISLEKFKTGEDMDFLNYMESDLDYIELSAIKLGWSFDFATRMFADINVIVMSDLVPDNYDISVHRFFNRTFGLGLGSLCYSNYIPAFEDYHKVTDPEYFILDQNMRQFESYDFGVYITPTFRPVYSDRLKILLRCDLGFSSFMEEHTSFYLKREFSNEMRLVEYTTVKRFQPYVNPKMKVKLKVFALGNVSVGILCNSNFLYSKKNMNYDRTIQVWTAENPIEAFIQPPKHNYTRFELDGGMYFAW